MRKVSWLGLTIVQINSSEMHDQGLPTVREQWKPCTLGFNPCCSRTVVRPWSYTSRVSRLSSLSSPIFIQHCSSGRCFGSARCHRRRCHQQSKTAHPSKQNLCGQALRRRPFTLGWKPPSQQCMGIPIPPPQESCCLPSGLLSESHSWSIVISGSEEIQCPVCGVRCEKPALLRSHMTREHSELKSFQVKNAYKFVKLFLCNFSLVFGDTFMISRLLLCWHFRGQNSLQTSFLAFSGKLCFLRQRWATFRVFLCFHETSWMEYDMLWPCWYFYPRGPVGVFVWPS